MYQFQHTTSQQASQCPSFFFKILLRKPTGNQRKNSYQKYCLLIFKMLAQRCKGWWKFSISSPVFYFQQHLFTLDKVGSNFSMQYLENLAYLQNKKLQFFLWSQYLQETKKLKELVMVSSTTCWILKQWLIRKTKRKFFRNSNE